MKVNQVATKLLNAPVVYNWRKLEVGPNYTVEQILAGSHQHMMYEVQSKGGAHIGLYRGLEEAILAVCELDSLVTIPQDLQEIKS